MAPESPGSTRASIANPGRRTDPSRWMSVVRMVTGRTIVTSSSVAPPSWPSTAITPGAPARGGPSASSTPEPSALRGCSTARSRSGSNSTTSAAIVEASRVTTSTWSDPATTCAAVTTSPSPIEVPVPSAVRGPHPSARIRTVAATMARSSGPTAWCGDPQPTTLAIATIAAPRCAVPWRVMLTTSWTGSASRSRRPPRRSGRIVRGCRTTGCTARGGRRSWRTGRSARRPDRPNSPRCRTRPDARR